MKKTELFYKKQSEMTDEHLYDLLDYELDKLCKTGGRSFKMTVPVSITDTDILISEMLKRFKLKVIDNQKTLTN